MRCIVVQLVRPCVDCKKCKEAKKNTKANLQPIVTTRRWQMLVIDFLGSLTETSLGNKYILTIVDHFTKYAIAFPIQRQDAATVTQCLTQVFSEFSVPESILSDKAKCFTSKEFMQCCELWNVKKKTSTSYRPETQGAVERFNGTIIQIIKRSVYEEQERWDNTLPFAIYSYNTTVQRSNGYIPYELVFGDKAVTPITKLVRDSPKENAIDDFVNHKRSIMKKTREIVMKKQATAQQYENERYDKGTRGQCFQIGERVLLYNPAIKMGENRKLSACYKGPFTIIEQIGQINFKIKPDEKKLKEQTVH